MFKTCKLNQKRLSFKKLRLKIKADKANSHPEKRVWNTGRFGVGLVNYKITQ